MKPCRDITSLICPKPNRLLRYLFCFSVLALVSAHADPPKPSAYQLWNQMVEQSFTHSTEPLPVVGTSSTVTFGAEKEGSSGLITRIMGPNAVLFKKTVRELHGRAGGKRSQFLKAFLSQFASGEARVNGVTDVEGKKIELNLKGLEGIDYSTLTVSQLDTKLDLLLKRTGDQIFAHLKPSIRMALFKGNFPGLDSDHNFDGKQRMAELTIENRYGQWVPLFGKAQKYISGAHITSYGWEINFQPQASYGEFEVMIDWFQEALKNAGVRFQAPGHQRLVYGQRSEMGAAEVHKNIQAYIVLRGLLGKSGIEMSPHQNIFSDEKIVDPKHNTDRGVIRLEKDRFRQSDNKETYSIELRSGTKNERTRRFVEQVIASRYAADEYQDLAAALSWELIPATDFSAAELVKRFGVSNLEAQLALKYFSTANGAPPYDSIGSKYIPPFWKWENAPYLSQVKKTQLKELTRNFIKSAAMAPQKGLAAKESLLADWVKSSDLPAAIEHYLIPKPPEGSEARENQEFHPARGELPKEVDVNKIDLGIEFTGRFPLKNVSQYEKDLDSGRSTWLSTQYDLTPKQREKLLYGIAQTLGEKIEGSKPVKITPLEASSHGHSINLGFALRDALGRDWRIEWDGVGRDYDTDGKLISESQRGGHVEIASPKFVPTQADLAAVHGSFAQGGLIPSHRAGGGHISVDLAPFDGKPKALARFIAKFLEHRGIISLMFQDPRRLHTAEPNQVSQLLLKQLRNFNGSEEELKKLLYNERFFNPRMGRKTQYTQLNLNAYFQDVIPEAFVHRDFDLKNDPWRENFSVDPKVRKAELRLFNAPETEREAQLQIKLVRAMLYHALNESTSPSGTAQSVEHEVYIRDPKLTFRKFDKTMQDLQLNPEEYKGSLLEGMAATRSYVESGNYVPLEKRFFEYPLQSEWGVASAVRPAKKALNSESRAWSTEKLSEGALKYKEKLQGERLRIEKLRQNVDEAGLLKRHQGTLTLDKVNPDKINDLSPREQLIIIHERLNGSPDSAEKRLLEERLQNLQVKAGLRIAIMHALTDSSLRSKVDFRKWLLRITEERQTFTQTEMAIFKLLQPETQLRNEAIAHLSRMSPEEQLVSYKTVLVYAENGKSELVSKELMYGMDSLPQSLRKQIVSGHYEARLLLHLARTVKNGAYIRRLLNYVFESGFSTDDALVADFLEANDSKGTRVVRKEIVERLAAGVRVEDSRSIHLVERMRLQVHPDFRGYFPTVTCNSELQSIAAVSNRRAGRAR